MIDESEDIEGAVLELLAVNPSSYFPPLASGVVEGAVEFNTKRKGRVYVSVRPQGGAQ